MSPIHKSLTVLLAAGAMAAALVTLAPAQEPTQAPAQAPMQAPAAEASMDKPLGKFTLGDLFPKVTGISLRDTGAAWQATGQTGVEMTSKREQDINEAVPKVQAGMAKMKEELKAAQRAKDFTAAGTAEGKLKTADIVLDVLDRIKTLTQKQKALAQAFDASGAAMLKLADADDAFDPNRAKGIEKPAAPGAPDSRLDPAGVTAFKNHATAIQALGKSFNDLGAAMTALASQRQAFMAELEKGGHVQPPPAK
jgi:hypothetical protein